ncbi:hypothetical protein [Pediococcus inopinatus]|uniref:hypothetical protein n=1 Tax=Pediococcus inopinatus TaxID=114090 RepID=UPI0007C552CB|nr:hypothetical protein [Pediococcus inopinatus]
MSEVGQTSVTLDDNLALADSAKKTANWAKSGLTDINDPNYLTPFEKPQLEAQMANFLNIYDSDKDIATAEGIDFTTYDAAYQAYLAYMTPLIADITTYSPIVRSTFNSMVTAVQVEQKRFSTATQAQYNRQIKQAQTDIDDGQTKYKALQSDAEIMKSSVAGVAAAADRAISSAGFASNTASEASNAASSAVASAMSAQSYASTAVTQASSAAADSKDAKQIAGAVSQSYKTLTDGSTMTIAELQNGLGAKLTKTDLDGYSTQTWTQNQIKTTADGINGTISSIKGTVDGHTTSINTLQTDSNGFKDQFTKVNDTVDKHTTDIGTLQSDAKSLSSNFSSLNTDNTTNKNDISQLKQTATEFNSTLMTVQTRVQDSAVGTNLAIGTNQEYQMGYGIPNTTWEDGYAYEKLPTTIYNSEILPQDSHSFWYTLTQGVTYTQTIWFETDANVKDLSAAKITWYTGAGHDIQPARVQKLGQNSYKVVSTYVWPGKSENNVRLFDIKSLNSAFDLSTGTYLKFGKLKLEKGSLATDWCPNPADNATVTALTQVKQTADSAQVLATNNQSDITKLQVTAKGLQSTVSDKVSSDQLTQLSGQLTNQIKDFSSSVNSQFTQTSNDINGLVKKGDVVNQFNLDAGGALLSTSGDSTKIVFSSPNIFFDTNNPVQIPNANIPGTLTGKTFEAGTITATTKITGADIEAPLIHSPSGSFKLDGNTGDIIGASIHSADNSWGISKDGIINGSTINGSTINAPTLDLGFNGTLTTDFNVSQPTSFYAPKKGTGTLTIKTGVINSSSKNMSRYSNTAAYWYGFDDNGNMVKNGTNQTGDDYAPGYEKHDIMKSTGAVLNRSYLDAMGLMFTEGGNSTYNTMLTGVGLETAAALLHKDLATDGTFKAALGTDNTYGFNIGSQVVAPMVQANKYTYAANMFISSYGTMGSSTSTKANKLDIVDVPDMLQKGYNLLTINPRQWFDKTSVEAYADVQSGNSDSIKSVVNIKPVTGMVAEEVASAGLDDYVVKDENNKVQGLAYDRLWTLLLPVLRDMNDKINKLQKKEGI